MTFDLDAARAAADDASRKPWPFIFRGKEFHVIRPAPIGAIIAIVDSDFRTGTKLLFGEEAQEVLAAGLDILDLRLILDELVGGQGEESASSGSSGKDGVKSRRTSKLTTE